jgi:hypothetical protein
MSILYIFICIYIYVWTALPEGRLSGIPKGVPNHDGQIQREKAVAIPRGVKLGGRIQREKAARGFRKGLKKKAIPRGKPCGIPRRAQKSR